MPPSPKRTTSLFLLTILATGLHVGPFFAEGQDPKPKGKIWKPVPALSDDFNGTSLDAAKWQSEPEGNGWSWIGRPPALFKADSVTLFKADSVKIHDGKMNVIVGKLE